MTCLIIPHFPQFKNVFHYAISFVHYLQLVMLDLAPSDVAVFAVDLLEEFPYKNTIN